MRDMWKLFPKLIEQKINALLDEAEPNRMKAFQLYKTCQNENLWNHSFEKFSEQLTSFFSLPKVERSKSCFDFYLNRPMHRSIFEQFNLDFRNSVVNGASLMNLSNWTHHMLRTNCTVISPVTSLDVFKKTFSSIVNPAPFEKAEEIEFDDFCSVWKRTVFNLFGHRYDQDLTRILNEVEKLNHEQDLADKTQRFIPGIYLTQTEITWTENVLAAALQYDPTPKFPLSKGPQKGELIELEKVSRLYWIIFESQKAELVQHRQKVRETLIYRCEELLKKRQH